MRNFIAVVAVSALVGIFTARQQLAVSAANQRVNSTVERITDLAAAPFIAFVPPSSLPPRPPVNLTATPFTKNLTAASALAVDNLTNTILFQKNFHTPRPLASITKLMTALILTERITDWDATTTVMTANVSEGNQTINAGEVYSRRDLLQAGLVGSINTAMNALVATTGLTPAEFVVAMNQRAQGLELISLHFVDPTGLSPQNVGSAQDVARLAKIVLSNARIKTATLNERVTIVEQKTKNEKIIKATDWFLNNVVPLKNATVEGGKTGYIPEAGYNFVSLLRGENGQEIRVVVLGAKDAYSRFTETALLADWVFANFQWLE